MLTFRVQKNGWKRLRQRKKKKREKEEDWKNVTDAEQGQGWSNQLGESLWRV